MEHDSDPTQPPGENTLPKRPSNRAAQGPLDKVQLKLLQRLQTTLDLQELLSLFFGTVHECVGTDSMTYAGEEDSNSFRMGEPSDNAADFPVTSPGQYLGKVTFTRQETFTPPELFVLGVLVETLFYSLHNALLYRQAVQSSMRDPLTSVGNRTALSVALSREVELAKRYDRPFGLMLIDVDHFKRINDSVGHAAGDAVLQYLANTLSSSLRQIDAVFRYGGEEFVALLTNTESQDAHLVAERIREILSREPPQLGDERIPLTVSIGLAMYRRSDSEDSLFNRADQALYQAKHSGRNRVVLGDQLG